MAYDLFSRKHNKTNASRVTMRELASSSLGADLHLTQDDRDVLLQSSEKVRKAGLFILGGLVLVSFAEVIAHRNMSFKGDGFFHHYKQGRGVK